MPDTLNRQRGFSLPEVILAMALLVITVTALSGYQQLWRYGWQQTALYSFSPPESWQTNRMQTTQAGCVSISVKLISPLGRQGQMSRLHCPKSQ